MCYLNWKLRNIEKIEVCSCISEITEFGVEKLEFIKKKSKRSKMRCDGCCIQGDTYKFYKKKARLAHSSGISIDKDFKMLSISGFRIKSVWIKLIYMKWYCDLIIKSVWLPHSNETVDIYLKNWILKVDY